MSITSLLSIAIGAILVNNFILSQFLGICPFTVSYTHLTLPTKLEV